MSSKQKDKIPCFLCSKPCEIRLSKKDKPYFVCNSCGIQVFVRGKPGIWLLDKLLEFIKGNQFEYSTKSLELLSLIGQLCLLTDKLEALNEKGGILGLFGSNLRLDKAKKILISNIHEIEAKIGKFRVNENKESA